VPNDQIKGLGGVVVCGSFPTTAGLGYQYQLDVSRSTTKGQADAA
jgi:hypothetical protein